MTSQIPLFVFGSLLNQLTLRHAMGHGAHETPAAAVDMQRVPVHPHAFDIVNSPGMMAPGAELSVTPHELARLDKWEHGSYSRIPVQLANGQTAWAYKDFRA